MLVNTAVLSPPPPSLPLLFLLKRPPFYKKTPRLQKIPLVIKK